MPRTEPNVDIFKWILTVQLKRSSVCIDVKQKKTEILTFVKQGTANISIYPR